MMICSGGMVGIADQNNDRLDLKTPESLLEKLRNASARSVTAEELHAQRVSFIMGSVKAESGITREQVQQVLAKQALACVFVGPNAWTPGRCVALA